MITQLLKISFVHVATVVGFVLVCGSVIFVFTKRAKPDPTEDIYGKKIENWKVVHGKNRKKAS